MRSARRWLADLALAAGLLVVGLVGTARTDGWGVVPDRPIDAAGLTVVAAAALVLVARRRWPIAVLSVSSVLIASYLLVGYPYGPIFFSFFVAVYTVARHRPLARSLPVSAGALGLLLTHHLTNSAALPGLWGVLPALAWVVVPFTLGVTIQVSRESAARERAEAIRQRVDDERLRMAQEVHDVVGHGLAAIRMQADVALHVLSKRPEQAEVALTAISRTSGEALDELRATFGTTTGADGSQPAATPRLGRLEELRQRMTDAGVAVEIETAGGPRDLPAVVDLTGYRIVQESLTNVLRHSRTKAATVRLEYAPEALVVVVSNPVEGTADVGRHGRGIPGMRQRVESLGGRLRAGPTSDGRFEVHATIPTEGHE